VFVWNEFFLAFSLTTNQVQTLPVYMSRFREQQGQFTAQLSASSTVSVLPALILGWLTQKNLVKGLTMGAVKG
jgi:sorbitol/mannitol transport system permease protein